MSLLTRIIVKCTKYTGWYKPAYKMYRNHLKLSRYKAWRGAFLPPITKEVEERLASWCKEIQEELEKEFKRCND